MDNLFITRLLEMTAALGLKRSKFADKIGSKASVIYGWEDGKSYPGFETLQKIYIATPINLNWLIGGEGEIFREGTPERKNNLGAIQKGNENGTDYKILYDQSLAQISLLERTVSDKEEIIKLLKSK